MPERRRSSLTVAAAVAGVLAAAALAGPAQAAAPVPLPHPYPGFGPVGPAWHAPAGTTGSADIRTRATSGGKGL
ncbi:hypothetical protein [Nonomuraea sp. NPDC052265]|uniref:hypothetical protein n=1 Tax=Nonomuraea sp. NPDC052265 TaxID=3364374 RepID=UPI0037C76B0E